MEKKIIVGSLMIAVVLLISFASAEFWACFNRGERIDYCNPEVNDRTAPNNNYELCMSSYNATRGCYNQGNWMVCMGIDRVCAGIGSNSTLDTEAPKIIINNPVQDGLYTSRSILLDLEIDEEADVYYYDNINGRGRWTRVCSNCYSYSRSRSFDEGFNDLTFRAVDVVGNEAFVDISFLVDSRKPRIHKTLPRNGYASGFFEVQYTEENLEKVEITYGNYLNGFKIKTADGSSTETLDCVSGTRQWCGIDIDLSEYEGQEIEYYFLVQDVVGNYKESSPKRLEVDTLDPVINNKLNFYNVTGRYVNFFLNITEKNLDKVEYLDYSDSKQRLKTLCSRLKDGICEKKVSFREDHHIVDIQVTDDAGNAIGQSINFTIG